MCLMCVCLCGVWCSVFDVFDESVCGVWFRVCDVFHACVWCSVLLCLMSVWCVV